MLEREEREKEESLFGRVFCVGSVCFVDLLVFFLCSEVLERVGWWLWSDLFSTLFASDRCGGKFVELDGDWWRFRSRKTVATANQTEELLSSF